MKAVLPDSKMPKRWYNILPDLPEPLAPPLDPETDEPMESEKLLRIFASELVKQEMSMERYIDIPKKVRELYAKIGRPTPLFRATNLEKALKTPARIYFKYEGATVTGSHKINTALAQAYYAKKQGIERLVTETGAGQWGTALSLAGALMGINVRVYMARASFYQKPYRKTIMRLYGAEIYPSPSDRTEIGRKFLSEDPNHPGGLGIAISEAIEDVLRDEKARYALGSVLNHVLMHQTVIGLEAKEQMKEFEDPDVIIGCVGGGSNFAGLAYPFVKDRLDGKADYEFIAVEPRAAPSMTRGVYTYDYGDSGGLTPKMKMHTLGHTYYVPPIHAGGLRYHGLAPTLSILINHGIVRPVAYHQTEIFEAARLFARAEGIVPAPESAHAVKAAIDRALKAKEEGKEEVILFNLSGHGLLDLKGYEDFLDGKLEDYEPEELPALREEV
ncbi:TrpB-like pyridoxal phosphate-dependent enzyme [Thermococcus sp. GR7]|uniref:TrpB-like pyridoxal phosphate-dependent enzyme n=1 Tax=unclassified Thermococcus TaxID=2627626 RepID=UPI00142F6FE1|nr:MULTISPECIES: TrpB-like pyridoxal phosphate-dependent enzyme [unclassified Thermococcus]NJE47027.1 TrpB-like pyridoxal phosphate-dependent enzyme [Thermococcus sp. GR7]NJE78148.1 TrpB-like pyridoxal phosphate-dependent enzyme [Thermococcus sp. GR4]NJF22735.1 TrpB-like pyridoxal phosphate-dependent enzyme [Thermococcus sp. GR5]